MVKENATVFLRDLVISVPIDHTKDEIGLFSYFFIESEYFKDLDEVREGAWSLSWKSSKQAVTHKLGKLRKLRLKLVYLPECESRDISA